MFAPTCRFCSLRLLLEHVNCFIRKPRPSVWLSFCICESVGNKALNTESFILRSASPALDPERHCCPGTHRSNPRLPETCSTLHPLQISATLILRMASLEQPGEDATVRDASTTDMAENFLCWQQSSQVFLCSQQPRDLSAGTWWLRAGVLRAWIQSRPCRGGATLLLQVFLVLLGSLSAVQEHSHHPHLQGLNQPKLEGTEFRTDTGDSFP